MDIGRGSIALEKTKFQNRARKTVILARLDLGGPPHRNPDGEEIPCPHLHHYREGYGDKWATAAPANFAATGATLDLLDEYMSYCNIVGKPIIEGGLFA
ncbi:MAG: hypothetical protein WCL50_07900 [Spirochaetota bacterium]